METLKHNFGVFISNFLGEFSVKSFKTLLVVFTVLVCRD